MKIKLGKFPKSDKPRKIKIKIHDYDIWNADNTLALIIAPLVRELVEAGHGAPRVRNKDVPSELHMSKEDKLSHSRTGKTDAKWFKRWDYVLNEIAWTFEYKQDDWLTHRIESSEEQHEIDLKRVKKGMKLFARYFDGMWT